MNFLSLLVFIFPFFTIFELLTFNESMDFSLLQANHFKMILPEIFLATSILVITVFFSIFGTFKKFGFPIFMKTFSRLSLLILALTFCLVVNNPITFMLIYQNTFIFDALTSSVKQIILISSFFCLFISENLILRQRINNFEYLILILCAILGSMLLVSSYDMLSLYLSIEMQSLCFYVLATFKKDSSLSAEAGLKYFILGSFSSALLLFGISLIYGCTGSLNFDNYLLLFAEMDIKSFELSGLIEKGLLCISAAFFFKIAAAPFHMWVPDVYEGSPTSSTIFFAIVPKIALFTIFLRLYYTSFGSFSENFLNALMIVSIFSVIIGSFVALRQRKLKRLLAYSSISHVGYILLAFASNSLEGVQSLFFYLIVYMITSLCLWTIVAALDTTQNKEKPKTLGDFVAISNNNPILGVTGMLAFFSLAGVPPLAGFFAKMGIFISSLSASLFFASLIAIFSSVISSFYYIRLIKTVYFEANNNNTFFFQISVFQSLTMGLMLLFLILLFLNPSLLFLITHRMALCLF